MVFTTTMVGYQEVTTDPSFRGQIVCMTYPLIGNYGIHPDANESRQPWIAGLIVREQSDRPSHAGSIGTIDEYLKRHGIPGISGIDTRALTLHIREVGDTRGSHRPEMRPGSPMPISSRAREKRRSRRSTTSSARSSRRSPETIDGPGPAHRGSRLRREAQHHSIARQARSSGDSRSVRHVA